MTTHLCDSNVWLALALSGHPHHRPATAWLKSADDPDKIVFCRATQQTLLRLLTNRTILGAYGNPPLTNSEAWRMYEKLLEDDRVELRTSEPPGLERRWKKLALRESASPKLWMDSYLAAFALAGEHRMVTADTGFKQFSGLDVHLLE